MNIETHDVFTYLCLLSLFFKKLILFHYTILLPPWLIPKYFNLFDATGNRTILFLFQKEQLNTFSYGHFIFYETVRSFNQFFCGGVAFFLNFILNFSKSLSNKGGESREKQKGRKEPRNAKGSKWYPCPACIHFF